MYSDILSLVKTTGDRDILLSEIEALRAVKFEPKDSIEKVLARDVRMSVAALFRQKVQLPDFDTYLDGLVQALNTLTEVKLTVAREPSSESINAIYLWLAKNLGESFIISLSLDPEILGGAIVAVKGKYYDGSLNRELNQVFSSERENLISIIHSSSAQAPNSA